MVRDCAAAALAVLGIVYDGVGCSAGGGVVAVAVVLPSFSSGGKKSLRTFVLNLVGPDGGGSRTVHVLPSMFSSANGPSNRSNSGR